MVDYIGKKMIVDTKVADGSVYFEKDHFEWRARDLRRSQYDVSIKYSDVKDIFVSSGAKKRVDVTLVDGKVYHFYLYKGATFAQFINAGREACNAIETNGTAPISDEDLDRLSKLTQLHKDGVLDDNQFESQKNEILKKYK